MDDRRPKLCERYDVAVLGGGLCGFAAACGLAEAGHKVILIERRPALGWEGTWAFLLDLPETDSPLADRLRDAMRAAGGVRGERIDAPILEMVLDREAEARRIEILYYCQPVALPTHDDLAAGVLLGTKEGELLVRAKAFVDATENALVWQEAGSPEPGLPDARASFVAFLNGASCDPCSLGELGGVDNVRLKGGVWDGEIAVEYDLPSPSVRDARCKLPGLLYAVRSEVSGLDEALVTHVAYETFPLGVADVSTQPGQSHPRLRNLLAAGPWCAEDASSLVSRIKIGEAAGEKAGEAVAALGDVKVPEVTPQSISGPPIHSADVVVCGGGTAGALAAIASARQGAKTCLLEAGTFLGGIGTGGGIHSYYHGVAGGIQDDVDQRLEELLPLFGAADKVHGFHPEAKKAALEQLAVEAGVEVIYETTITGVEAEDVPGSLPATGEEVRTRRVRGLNTAGPHGAALYRARAFIDSTGDGDVAAMAGAPYTYGREFDGLPHAYSQPKGRLDDKGNLCIVNFDAGYCDPTDVVDLTRARRRGLRHLWQDSFTPATRPVYIAPLIGLRNSRQILGDYCLTFRDEITGRHFPDTIAYAKSHYDNHAFDYENESDEAVFWVWVLGNWQKQIGCEIPYRCLLPQHVEGLLVACRAVSQTHDAHNQLRMQRDMQRLGEAAGVAAALAAAQDTTPRALDVAQVQAVLTETGAIRPPAALPEPGPSDWQPPPYRERPVAECVAELESDKPQGALWALTLAGQDALPALREAAKSGKPAVRYGAASVLAMLRDEAAIPELTAALEERRGTEPGGRKAAPQWQSAIALLGRVGNPESAPAVADVLQEPGLSLDVALATLRALGRLGNEDVVPAIDQFLARTDVAMVRDFQVSSGGNQVTEDARWQTELTAADTLAKLGAPRPELIGPHLEDARAHVRRFAQKVRDQASMRRC